MESSPLVRPFLRLVLMTACTAALAGCPAGGPGGNGNGGNGGGARAPVAEAGPDQTVGFGESVTLTGEDSSDPNGDSLTFQWTQTDGPDVTLAGAGSARAAFTAPSEAAILAFELRVEDPDGNTDTDNVIITVTANPGNRPPLADAGPDRSVRHGQRVTLNGAGSSDPDEDFLTFQWSQSAGTMVTLEDADTATPAFTAPGENATLTFQLRVRDPFDAEDIDVVVVTVAPPPPPQLFIANFGGEDITSYSNPTTREGDLFPTTFVSGSTAGLRAPRDVVVNSAGLMFVSNLNSASITVYTNATTATGSHSPVRTVTGDQTQIDLPLGLAYNEDLDVLFVTDNLDETVMVFRGVSQPAFNGNIAPNAVITSGNLDNPFGIYVTPADDLYLANNGGDSVLIFGSASTADPPALSRMLTSELFLDIFDVFVDESDTLYVVEKFTGSILIFRNASTLNGGVTPDATIEVPAAESLVSIVVDTEGTGYVLDSDANAVFVYEDIASRSGAAAPDRTIVGEQTQLNAPTGLFLFD